MTEKEAGPSPAMGPQGENAGTGRANAPHLPKSPAATLISDQGWRFPISSLQMVRKKIYVFLRHKLMTCTSATGNSYNIGR